MPDAVVAIGVHLPAGAEAVVLLRAVDLRAAAHTADEWGIEARQVLLHARRVVAFGIDRDVHPLDARGVITEFLARAGQCRERDGTDLAAGSEAEGQQHQLGAEARQIEWRSVGGL